MVLDAPPRATSFKDIPFLTIVLLRLQHADSVYNRQTTSIYSRWCLQATDRVQYLIVAHIPPYPAPPPPPPSSGTSLPKFSGSILRDSKAGIMMTVIISQELANICKNFTTAQSHASVKGGDS